MLRRLLAILPAFVVACADAQCVPDCAANQICAGNACIAAAACDSNAECGLDTRCDDGLCRPWNELSQPTDLTCGLPAPTAVMKPELKCAFDSPPAGDPFPTHVEMLGSAISFQVAPPGQPPVHQLAAVFAPTVVSGSYSESGGVLRVLNGEDCSLIANLGGIDLTVPADGVADFLVAPTTPTAADLNQSGNPELVTYGDDGSLVAFEYVDGEWNPDPFWITPRDPADPWQPCTPGPPRCPLGWGSAVIHDLDDDGVPEVIRESVVYSAAGVRLSGPAPNYTTTNVGMPSVVANLDQDPALEMTSGEYIYEWNGQDWIIEPYYPRFVAGYVAVADFGDYGSAVPASNPELVISAGVSLHIRAITGEDVLVASAPNPGNIGPPTVADMDGDGLAEAGVFSREAYSVVDPDCLATPRPGGVCADGPCDFAGGICPDGFAWSRRVDDASSGITSSISFDLEGDGLSEILMADECFLRGVNRRGEAVFSLAHANCTFQEQPVYADVDGDQRGELVVGASCAPAITNRCALNANRVDPLFNGQQCDLDSDCRSRNCDRGLCRCISDADCCGAADDAACAAAGHVCVAPEPGTAGEGNVCRTARPEGLAGLRVFEDTIDRWSNTRPIWNQHAYAVSHINSDMSVPQTSQWQPNWLQPELNSFRSNPSYGNPVPDLTAAPSASFSCDFRAATMTTEVCNRGAEPQRAGVPVSFSEQGGEVCRTATTVALDPGVCETVSCIWPRAPGSAQTAADISVMPDPENGISECLEANNTGLVQGVFCALPDPIFGDSFEVAPPP